MSIIKKVAAMGAVAAVGALAVKRDSVKKAVRGLIGSGNDAVHSIADKTDELANRADKALSSATSNVKADAKSPAPARVTKQVRGKKPRAARRKARHAAHAATT